MALHYRLFIHHQTPEGRTVGLYATSSLQVPSVLVAAVNILHKSVCCYLRMLTVWHCPCSSAARNCCSSRLISPACWAHSSKPAVGLLFWAHAGIDKQTDRHSDRRCCFAYYVGSASSSQYVPHKMLVCVIFICEFDSGICTVICCRPGVLYNAQDMLLYYPEQPSSSRLYVDSPSSFGLHYENVFVRSHDGTLLHAQFVRQPSHLVATVPTFVFFHGNAGNIGHRLPNIQLLYNCCNVNVLLVEYRGYGKSCGQPSEQGSLHFCIG